MYNYFPSMKCRSDAEYIEGIAKYLSKPFIIVSPSKNGHEKSSIKMFKEISKNKLVIMVSHNNKLIDKYDDEIITIKDGVIAKQKTKVLR